MSFQRAFVPCQLFTDTHTQCILQLVLQPENLFKYFLERLVIETGDKALKAGSTWVTTAQYCGQVESEALSG